MKPMIRCGHLALLWLGLATATPGAAAPAGLTGLLTQVDGAVQLIGLGVGDVPLARPWQVVRAGVKILVPARGAAGIVCSNRRFVRLAGPASWSVSEPACAAGKELTSGEYALVAPHAGRFNVVEGLLTLEREVRAGDGDDPLAPIILAPRNTVLRSPRPTVTWAPLPSAIEYRLEWSGSGASYDTRLSAQDLACAAAPDRADTCALPWPADRPALAPGEIFFLKLAARGGIVQPWHSAGPVEVRTMRIADAVTLEGRLRSLAALGLEGPALAAARAGLLAAEGLYAEAAQAYGNALAAAPSAELRVTLADVELITGLFQVAEPLYRQAATGGEPAVQAAAAFGLGRIEYSRGRYREAAMEFRQARDLYGAAHLNEAETAARQAAARAAARSLPR